MRLALQLLLLQLAIRLLIPRFFSTACSYSVRPRLSPSEPAVNLPQALAIVRSSSQSIHSTQTFATLSSEPPATCNGLRLLRSQVNSLRQCSLTFEALRLG